MHTDRNEGRTPAVGYFSTDTCNLMPEHDSYAHRRSDEDAQDVGETVTCKTYANGICGFPRILQNPLELRMPPSRLLNGDSLIAPEYRSHYEITDLDLYSYILSIDAEAWHHFLCDITICPFCGTEVTPRGSCCLRFSELRQATAAEARRKHLDQEAEKKSKGGKSKGKKFSVTEEAKWRTKSFLATRYNERRSSKYHFGAIQDQQKLVLTRAPAIPTVHAAADGVGGTQQSDSGKVGHSVTISYQLSSQKCLVDGWTVWPLARPSLRCESVDPHSLCDEMLEPDQPLYKEFQRHRPADQFYDSGNRFLVIFPDGSGSLFYPSGRLAVSIVTVRPGLFTYILQKDVPEADIVAVFQPTGHGIIYHDNGLPRVCLMPTGVLELWPDGSRRRRWNWSELESATDHDPFPKVYPLVLGVNYNCGIRIFSQHNMSLTFSAECRSCRFYVGARIKKSQNRLEPLKKKRSWSSLYIRDVKTKVRELMLKMSTALQFPNSPKLSQIPVPRYIMSQREKDKPICS